MRSNPSRFVNKNEYALCALSKDYNIMEAADLEIFSAIKEENQRQEDHIELIASENYASKAVMAAQGTQLTNKYAEGYPGKRYYGGCEYVDKVERLAISRLKSLFGCDYANVQPHSGAQANAAIFLALLQPGDTVLGMNLSQGGHLTHGHPANFSGKQYKVIPYGVNALTGLIDYDEMERLAIEHKPKLMIGGFSAYSRVVDWKRMREIADKINAYLWVDMAHVAGLIAAGVYPSPVDHSHVVTSTTHKTLRGPRGGFIITKGQPEDFNKKFDSAVFPGIQGGPLMHVIAAKAIAFKEALDPTFRIYAEQVVKNARTLSEVLIKRGYSIVSNGTDDHLILLDLRNKGLTGREVETALGKANITVNKNTVPGDTRSPFVTSGIRLGSAACTTRGFMEGDMETVGNCISDVLDALCNKTYTEEIVSTVRGKVGLLCKTHPVY